MSFHCSGKVEVSLVRVPDVLRKLIISGVLSERPVVPVELNHMAARKERMPLSDAVWIHVQIHKHTFYGRAGKVQQSSSSSSPQPCVLFPGFQNSHRVLEAGSTKLSVLHCAMSEEHIPRVEGFLGG